MRIQRFRGASRKGQRGNALIEFALAFTFIVPLFLGSYEFGHAFYVYNGLQSAVRGGARYASLRLYNSATETPSDAYLSDVRNMVVYGDPEGGTTSVVPGLSPSDVSVTMQFVEGIPRNVTVGITSYRANAVVDILDFNTKPQLQVPYMGRWEPI